MTVVVFDSCFEGNLPLKSPSTRPINPISASQSSQMLTGTRRCDNLLGRNIPCSMEFISKATEGFREQCPKKLLILNIQKALKGLSQPCFPVISIRLIYITPKSCFFFSLAGAELIANHMVSSITLIINTKIKEMNCF